MVLGVQNVFFISLVDVVAGACGGLVRLLAEKMLFSDREDVHACQSFDVYLNVILTP